jgi:glycine betaine/choline ABC-type transport system substrate-binding protein
MNRRLIRVHSCALAALLLLGSCGRDNSIVVGSKNFTEQLVLGEIAAQQLERKLHIKVTRKLNLGGTLLTHEAIVHGDIDIYPEYTGTAASVVLKKDIASDGAQAYMEVKDAYLARYGLIWLPPLGFNDTFAMVVRQEDAQRLAKPELSSAGSRKWRLGVGYEFLTRPDGLQRLDKAYSLQWQGTPRSMDLGLLYQALQQKKVDMAAGNSTDAQLAGSKFAVLRDDRRVFPPYNACFVVRRSLVQQRREVEWALSMLSNHISDQTMRELNRRVEQDRQPIEKVAREFLAGQP